jgi:ABC-type spermidine/putrescine transport system permease subunit II
LKFLVAVIAVYLVVFLMAVYKTSAKTKQSIEHLRKFGVKNFEGYLDHQATRNQLAIARITVTWGTIIGFLACLAILAIMV